MRRNRVVSEGIAQGEDVEKMIQIAVSQHNSVKQEVVDVQAHLGKRTEASIENDTRLSTFDRVAATALSLVRCGCAVPEYFELHAAQFLPKRALCVAPARFLPDPAPEYVSG